MAVSHLLAVAAIAGTAHAAPTPDELDALATAAPVAGDAPAPVTRAYELPCWCVRAEGHLGLDGRIGATTAYPLDAAGTPSASSAALSPRLRVGLSVGALRGRLRWLAEYEHDLPTGTLARTTPDGPGMPDTAAIEAQLRKASLRVMFGQLILGGGVTTSHWGLGLVANDGAHGWEPGSARFADPRGGDRVLRGYAATGPYTAVGLMVAVAAERVLDDDALLTTRELGGATAGDTANQVLGTVTVGVPTDRWAGAYVAYRHQRAADGRDLHVTAVDVSAIGHRTLAPHAHLMVGLEAAYLRGDTTLAPTVAHVQETVGQLGLALRSSLDLGRWGVALDALIASGDDNLDDGEQHGFRANHNFDLGLVLFEQVEAAQTARGVITASDPRLVAEPVSGAERIATRGAATNTVAVFPRAFVRPARGIELYGGPLLAWAAKPMTDPFNTTIAGGQPTNAIGGTTGSYLGTELDVGVRARIVLWGAELALGVEAGVLLPGRALRDGSGTAPGAIESVRAMAGVRL